MGSKKEESEQDKSYLFSLLYQAISTEQDTFVIIHHLIGPFALSVQKLLSSITLVLLL